MRCWMAWMDWMDWMENKGEWYNWNASFESLKLDSEFSKTPAVVEASTGFVRFGCRKPWRRTSSKVMRRNYWSFQCNPFMTGRKLTCLMARSVSSNIWLHHFFWLSPRCGQRKPSDFGRDRFFEFRIITHWNDNASYASLFGVSIRSSVLSVLVHASPCRCCLQQRTCWCSSCWT